MAPPASSAYTTTLSASPPEHHSAPSRKQQSAARGLYGSATKNNSSNTLYASSASALVSSDVDDVHGAGTSTSSTRSAFGHVGSRKKPHKIRTNMSSMGGAAPSRSTSGRAKLHKRAGSGSSIPASQSPSGFAGRPTPYATYEEQPFPDAPVSQEVSSKDKIKPYLRKISGPKEKEDQGQIDLSTSTADNERLAGLGIQDFGASNSPLDISFPHTSRRQHTRTTSVGSQVSNTSGSFRPTQPFVHPMRQTPRPYTPPTGTSFDSSLISNPNHPNSSSDDDEAAESSDIIDDDFRLGHGFRTRRSTSITSASTHPQTMPPTPLSQSHTLEDLGDIPKLTSLASTAIPSIINRQTPTLPPTTTPPHLSPKKSKPHILRKDTSLSPASPPTQTPTPARASLDKARTLLHTSHHRRRSRSGSDLLNSEAERPSTESRDEQIRAARRKFEAREAGKERKAEEKEARKLSRKSGDGGRRRPSKPSVGDGAAVPAVRYEGLGAGGRERDASGSAEVLGGRAAGAGSASQQQQEGTEATAFPDFEAPAFPVAEKSAGGSDHARGAAWGAGGEKAAKYGYYGYEEREQRDGSGSVGGGGGRGGRGSGGEKAVRKRKAAQSGWLRFETWMRTRLVGCGTGSGSGSGSSSSRDRG